jgi:hypothetical protein
MPDFIEDVLVAPSSKPWFHELVCKVVTRYKLDCP